MSRRKRTVADFPPEMIQAWEAAAQGKLQLTFPSKGAATNFRQQLYTFRKAFVSENGQAAIAHWYNYDLVVKPDAGEMWVVTTAVADWKQQLRERGATIATLPGQQDAIIEDANKPGIGYAPEPATSGVVTKADDDPAF